MQFAINFQLNNLQEVEKAAHVLCRIAGLTILTAAEEESAGASIGHGAPKLPPADNPSTGLDTAAVFGGTPPRMEGGTSPQGVLTPVAPPAMVTNAGAAQGLPVAPGGAVELDGEGLPWDERIHSSNHKKGDNGLWMMRRGVGVQKAMVERVKAELRATLPSTTPQATNVAPLFPAPAVTPAAPTLPALPPLPVAPTVAAPAPSGATQPALPAAAPTNLQELMQQVAPLMAANKVTAETLTQACTMAGVTGGLPMLATAPAATVGMVWALLPK